MNELAGEPQRLPDTLAETDYFGNPVPASGVNLVAHQGLGLKQTTASQRRQSR